jgi:hypothetical protein
MSFADGKTSYKSAFEPFQFIKETEKDYKQS